MDLFNFIPKLENAHQTGISSKNIGGYKPSLIEPGMQSYIKGTLKNCKNYKNQYFEKKIIILSLNLKIN